MEERDALLKLIIIGDTNTGKSCLLRYFLEKKFRKSTQANHTIGVEFGSKLITVRGKQVKLQIWDTAGQERFRAVTRSYYRGAIGCLLVYDITSRESFNHVVSWLTEARSLARSDISLVVVGNKADLGAHREVSTLEASRFAQENELLYMETSAKTGESVEEAFLKVASTIMNKITDGTINPASLRNVYDATAYTTPPTPPPSSCAC